MPITKWTRRTLVAGLAGRARRQRTCATLSAGLTLPVVLLGLSTPGCRTDSSSARLSSLYPTRWLAREEATEDSFELQPVPGDEPTAPPLPPSPPRREAFAPAPAPTPEPVSHEDAEELYGVRPTGAEVEGPGEPSWSARFRSLFKRDATGAANPPRPGKASVVSAESVERRSAPSDVRITRRRTAVRLDRPEFESAGVVPEAFAVAPASQVEPPSVNPTTSVPVSQWDRLPVIMPGQSPTRVSTGDFEPQAWPYPVGDQAEPAPMPTEPEPAPIPAVTEPMPIPADASPVPRLRAVPEEESGGPALWP